MADVAYRANLSAPNIPIDPLTQGRTVIMKGYDNNYAPNLAASSDSDKDIGIPQVLYVANALPTEYGFRSIQYFGSDNLVDGTPLFAFTIRGLGEAVTLIHSEEGNLTRKDGDIYVNLGTYVGKLTTATVSGTTYLGFAGVGVYSYNFLTDSLEPVTLQIDPIIDGGVDPADILGITGSGGYLIYWTAEQIGWSSLVDPTDLRVSLDTGAGSGFVEGARGAITVCVPNPYGFFVFTESNCVSAQISGNSRYPFNFKEIVGSAGVLDLQQVTYDGNQGTAYAYTTAGFQQITHQAAKTVWTSLYDDGDVTPTLNETTVSPNSVIPGIPRQIQGAKLVVVASRYVCVSVKKGEIYNAVWVFDLVLQRWGRLVIDHYEVYEDTEAKIAVITTESKCVQADTSFNSSEPKPNHESYILLGKYQYSRQRYLTLHKIELENLYPESNTSFYPDVFVMTSLDGKSGEFASTFRDTSLGEAYAQYLCRKTGMNHSILIKGNFILNSVQITFVNHGAR